MSDIYADENLNVVQGNEIGPSGPLLMAPDLHAAGGLTYHQGADYGLPDTTVTVVDGTQCVHDGVTYGGGETVSVPRAVAQHWVRSGWATSESDPDVDTDAEVEPPVKTPAKPPTRAPARATAAGSGRRKS
jgi:hypothetical protein